uniref:RNA-directed RNA polymerase L n=1 Tax=Blattella germanica phenuivirus 1 TaxID=3133449 RepID=A0AAT9JFI2_9VIRU
MEKYFEPLHERIEKLRNKDELVDRAYWMAPIIVGVNSVVAGTELRLQPALVSELCARYRFANAIIHMATAQGLTMGESAKAQELIDIDNLLLNLPIYYDVEDGTGREMTQHNIGTEHISEEEAKLYAGALYNSALIDGIHKMGKPEMQSETILTKISEYKRSIIGDRYHDKAIIQLPGIIPTPWDDLAEMPVALESGPMFEVWNAVINAVSSGDVDLTERTVDQELDIAMRDEMDELFKDISPAKREYHRITLDLLDETKVDLAKVGINGKKMRDNGEVRAYREEVKEGFQLDTSVDDLETYLGEVQPFLPHTPTPTQDHISALVDKAIGIHGPDVDKQSRHVSNQWVSSALGVYYDMITEIGGELSISLKQHVASSQFVLKKLPNFGLWMLIKPTNSSSHIFVSFMFKGVDKLIYPEGIAKRINHGRSFCCTDFVSFNTSKLVNIIKAGPFSLTMLGQWIRFFEDSVSFVNGNILVRDLFENKSFHSMFHLSMLISLEDKSKTEEIFTLFRYISMAKFERVPNDPTKMLEKFPTVIRSRLQVWAINKLISSFHDPKYYYVKDTKVESPLRARAGSPSSDNSGMEEDLMMDHQTGRWINMINPYNRDVITDPRKLIELYYLGYAKNKDEQPSANTEFELVRKIIKYEDALDLANPSLFGSHSIPVDVPAHVWEALPDTVDVPKIQFEINEEEKYKTHDVKFHEWSNVAVSAAVDSLKGFLKKLHGQSWQEEIDNQIKHRFRKITWEQIATLKASSIFDPSTGKNIEQGKVRSQRIKVLSAVLNQPEYLHKKPWEVLPMAIKWVNEDGGLRVDIFKKNQHGGLREIYVLELRSRIIQLFIEELSRAICENLPIEVMMHPENKINKPQEHIIKASKKKFNYKASCDSSNDARVWNQGHHVNKFAQFLCRLLPMKYHALVISILKQWRHKRIALPNGVLNLLLTKPETTFYNPMDQKLADGFTGRSKMRWISAGKHYITVESGMMQGILHYTSSLFHASVLMLRNNLFLAMCNNRGFQVITTDLVSSDDSARMTDCFANNESQLREVQTYVRADHMCIDTFGKYFGIWLSPKSTQCSENVLEFNSEFFFRASLTRPTIKWAYAALSLVEVESLFERQEVAYNLCSQLLEGGAGFFQTAITQIAQAQLHYRMLGAGFNKLWPIHANSLHITTDPSLGFFLMDNPRACGLFGLNYSFWLILSSNPDLQSRVKQQMMNGDLTTTTSGALTGNVQVRFGNRQKAMRLIEEASQIMTDWREFLEIHPETLYKFPKTFSETVARLLVKLTSPSVTTALSKGNEISRMMAASVYLISRQANTIGSAWMSTLGLLKERYGPNDPKSKKVSLIKLSTTVPQRALMTDDDFEVLFPNHSQYSSIRGMLLDVDRLAPAIGGTRKSLRSHISVYAHASRLPFTLEQMARYRWFNEFPGASASFLEKIWLSYQEIIPWLRDSLQDTLEASPYEDHIQLRNFIAREGVKSRNVHLTGSPVKSSDTRDMVTVAIIRNQFPGVVLIRSGSEKLAARSGLLEKLLHGMACITGFPWSINEKKQMIMRFLREQPQLWRGEERKFFPRATQLGVIQAWCKMVGEQEGMAVRDGITPQEFNMILDRSRLGAVGGFTRPQAKRAGVYSGSGSWAGSIGRAMVHIDISDSTVIRVITNSIYELRNDVHLLRKLLADFGLSPIQGSGDSISGSKWRLEAGDIQPGLKGTPVIEDKSYRFKFDLDVKNISLRLTDQDVSLITTQPRVSEIVKFRSYTNDYRFNIGIPINGGELFNAWCQNKSLPAAKLEQVLSRLVNTPLRPGSKYDKTSLKDFFGTILLSTMHQAGWDLSTSDLQTLIGVDESITLDDDVLRMMDDLSFLGDPVNDEILGEDFQSGSEGEEDLSLLLGMDVLGVDELVDFKFAEKFGSIGDIRKTHRLMSDLVRYWSGQLGRKGKEQLMKRKYMVRNKEISMLVGYLLDWDMLEIGELEVEDDGEILDIMYEFDE